MAEIKTRKAHSLQCFRRTDGLYKCNLYNKDYKKTGEIDKVGHISVGTGNINMSSHKDSSVLELTFKEPSHEIRIKSQTPTNGKTFKVLFG